MAVVLGAASPWTPTVSVWINGAVFTMGAFSGNASQGTFAASVPAYQAFGLKGNTSLDFYGYMQWLGFSGMDALPTLADAQWFHDHPQAWLAASGLDAYWYCKEDTGTNVDNVEGTAGRDLTLTGATWNSLITSANGGDARNAAGTANSGDSFNAGYRFFDGADDCIGITDAASLRFGTAPYQIHIWAAIDAAAANENICGKGDVGAGEWYLNLQTTQLFYSADTLGVVLDSNTDVTDGLLHLFSVLRNGNDVKLYIDGVEKASASVAHNLSSTKAVQLMAADDTTPCKGNLFKVLLGTKNVSIAAAGNDMKSLFSQGPYR